MKKILILIFSFILFINTNVEARKGCCSHHHGVKKCDTNNGRLLCNDNTYSPSCNCEYIKEVKKVTYKKSPIKKIIQKNYNCKTMVISERIASYYKKSDLTINLGAIIQKTKVVKTGKFINNMFEVKIDKTKDRVWIKKEDCNCL